MTIDLRPGRRDDLEALVQLDFRNFGGVVDDGDVDAVAEELELDRFLLAWDGERLVAAAGSYAMELTLPGHRTVPMSGVTWVSVAATHRRQGLARRLMDGLDELSAGYGEPLLGLTASEGAIYERFGYGTATRIRSVELDRHRATIERRWHPEPTELVLAGDHVEELFERWDRYRRRQIGEVSRSEEFFRAHLLDRNKPTYAALHPDGYVVYSIEPQWNEGHPGHRLTVGELVAATPEAHLALWNLVLSIDLIGPIRCRRSLALDDPLPQLLTDPRAVRTIELNDGLWLKVTDPIRCFDTRTYRADDRLVVGLVETVDDLVEVAAGRRSPTEGFAVGADGCHPTGDEPDLVVCRSSLGPLLLGGSASELAAGRRLLASDEVLARADVLFGIGAHAHCRTPF